MKTTLIANLNKIAEASKTPGYNYEVSVKEWNSGSKSRAYFSIIETRDGSKHYAKKDYGYFDNVSETYEAAKYGNLNGTLFTFGGSKID